MARKLGLTRGDVLDAAVHLLDDAGLQGVTLGRVAKHLGIKTPSLYAHVTSADDLQRQLTLFAAKDFRSYLEICLNEGADPVESVVSAQLNFAEQFPGRYDALQNVAYYDDEISAEMYSSVIVLAEAVGLDVTNEGAIHRIRLARSLLVGYISLLRGDGFRLEIDLEDTRAKLVPSVRYLLLEG